MASTALPGGRFCTSLMSLERCNSRLCPARGALTDPCAAHFTGVGNWGLSKACGKIFPHTAPLRKGSSVVSWDRQFSWVCASTSEAGASLQSRVPSASSSTGTGVQSEVIRKAEDKGLARTVMSQMKRNKKGEVEEPASLPIEGMDEVTETQIVDFVREFVDNSVGKRSFFPRVTEALRSAGFHLEKGALPLLLKKHPDLFAYNSANQYVQLKKHKESKVRASSQTSICIPSNKQSM